MDENNNSVDLEVQRDAKVVPVAVAVMRDISEAKDDSIVKTITERALDADFNLMTENSYMFQLIVGVFSALTTLTQKCKVADPDDARFEAIGKEIMGLLAGAAIPMGAKVTKEDQAKAVEAIQPQLEIIFEREHLTLLEVNHVLQSMLQNIQNIEQAFENKVRSAIQLMEEKLLGVASLSDMTMKKLDDVLKEPTGIPATIDPWTLPPNDPPTEAQPA